MGTALEKAGTSGDALDLYIFGNVLRTGHGQSLPREAAFKIGIPDTVNSYAVDMVCSSIMMSAIMYDQRSGSVVCISSISGEQGNLGQTNYGPSKAAVIGLTKSLAREAAMYGVRVNVVAPGFIETDMLNSISEKVKQRI
jgi:NAD(P)-dependent dehydrogenase (short-subunit alcohol dehydrogenase family)